MATTALASPSKPSRWGRERNARRFHGLGRFGRASTYEADRADLRDALRNVAEAAKAIDMLASPETAALAQNEVDIRRNEALSRMNLAKRQLVVVMDRHDYAHQPMLIEEE